YSHVFGARSSSPGPTRRRFAEYRLCRLSLRSFPFFFQAEDGIRDDLVTGVQTCALPISPRRGGRRAVRSRRRSHEPEPAAGVDRSEERRVGKESRSRRAYRTREKNET